MSKKEEILSTVITDYLSEKVCMSKNICIDQECSQQFYENIKYINKNNALLSRWDDKNTKKTFDLIIKIASAKDILSNATSCNNMLKKNGILIICIENESFVQQKRLPVPTDLNKLQDVMRDNYIYEIFKEPVGKFVSINKLSDESLINKILNRIGQYIPNSKTLSPYYVIAYKKLDKNTAQPKPYKSESTWGNRLFRIIRAVTKKMGISHYLNNIRGYLLLKIRYEKMYKSQIIGSIPTHKKTPHKKAVLICMTYMQIGGVERVILNILKGINKDLFDIHILTTEKNANVWHDEFKRHSDYIIHVPNVLDDDWPLILRSMYVSDYAKKNNIDTVFITNSTAAYRATPAIKKANPTVKIFDLLHTHGTPSDNDAYLRTSMPFDKYIDKRIVIDQYLKSYYTNKYPVDTNKILVIYNGIDNDELANFCFQENKIMKDISLDSKNIIISYIGRLDADKSPMRLVAIANRLKDLAPTAKICVVGSGTLTNDMVNMAKEKQVYNKNIFFIGNSNNPLSIDKQSDFTILVSNAEGIPMSALESMSMGTPVISSAVGGIPEIIDDKINGFLIKISYMSEDEIIEAFTKTIVDACSLNKSKLKNMKKMAINKIDKRFSNMAEKYEQLFTKGSVKS